MAWTIQKLIDDQMSVTAYCQVSACNHSKRLDLETLKAKLGPDAPAMADDLKPRLVCAICGGKSIGLIYAPHAGAWGPEWKKNAYLKAKGG